MDVVRYGDSRINYVSPPELVANDDAGGAPDCQRLDLETKQGEGRGADPAVKRAAFDAFEPLRA